MRTRWFLAGLVLCCVTVFTLAQSQPPVPTPSKQGEREQNKSSKINDANDSKTHSLPAFAPQPNAPNKKDAPQERDNDSSAPWWIWVNVGLTLAIAAAAWSQVHVYRLQAKLMERGLEETQKSTGAAIKAANATETASENAERSLQVGLFQIALLQSFSSEYFCSRSSTSFCTFMFNFPIFSPHMYGR